MIRIAIALLFSIPAFGLDCIEERIGWMGRPMPMTPYFNYVAQQVTYYNKCNQRVVVGVCYQSPTTYMTNTFECSSNRSTAPNAAIISVMKSLSFKMFKKTCISTDSACIATLRSLNRCNRQNQQCIQ